MTRYDQDDLSNTDRILQNYVREEKNIYSMDIFKKLKLKYSNQEPLTLYRGMNFKTEDDYNEFMEKIEQNSVFKSESLSGFSRCYDTAQDFSETTKTYFPDELTMVEEAVRGLTGESMTGYLGVVITVNVDAGDVVDINRSGLGIEDELLLAPDTEYDCTVTTVTPLRERIKSIDINSHVESYIEKGLNDSVFNYIIRNHADDITQKNKELILNSILFKKEDKCFIDNKGGVSLYKLLNKDDNLIIYSKKDFSFRNNNDELDVEKSSMIVPKFAVYSKFGIFDDKKIMKKITNVSNEIMIKAIHFYIHNKERDFDFEGLRQITPYITDGLRDLHKRMVSEKNNYYGTMQSSAIKEINEPEKSKEEKQKLIDIYKKDLINMITSITNEIPLTMDDVIKEQEKTVSRKKDSQKRLTKLLKLR
jgi:hypothetical protein